MESKEDCIGYALHAYDTFWDYYKKTLDERNQILNNYIIFVGLPISVVGLFADKIKNNISDYIYWLISALVIFLILGIIIFNAYIVESFVSEKYLNRIKHIVEYLQVSYDSRYNKVFSEAYTLDGLFLNRGESQKHRLRKSFLIIIINTVILIGIFCLVNKNNFLCCNIVISSAISVFIHMIIFLYQKKVNEY